ncbi:MAG: hypothetical protein SWJ54_02430 [Cyanobacteriota bacterium]|nr:hypothetical protein [Cyanobacteriota bacterium]
MSPSIVSCAISSKSMLLKKLVIKSIFPPKESQSMRAIGQYTKNQLLILQAIAGLF